MFTSERRTAICELLKKQSAVTTAALSQKFDVSIETIRKDLLFLENHQKLIRVHGGAVSKTTDKPYNELSQRKDENKDQKRELSRLAAEFVEEGDRIAIDSGSTAVEFIEELMKQFHSLTIVTYSMDVFEKVRSHTEFQVILCGGYFLPDENAFYGPFVKKMLNDIHVNKVFLSPSAISLQNGICDYQPLLFEIQQKLLTIGNEIIVIADSSKYEKNALFKIDNVNTHHIYISDSKLPKELKELYKNNHIKIITQKEECHESSIDFE